MKAIIQPTKKYYRVLYLDTHHIRITGMLELIDTPKGIRPVKYRIRHTKSGGYRNTPSKDLVTHLRRARVHLTSRDKPFESFLQDLQIQFSYVSLCRFCLMDDRVTELDKKNAVTFGEHEEICMDCARKELRRELIHMGRLGRSALTHLDELLEKYRSVDRVLATIEPDRLSMGHTMYDRLEAHPVLKTLKIEELPFPHSFVSACGVEFLMPVQQLAVEAGLLYGKDLLVVSATASGKTFIGEMAGLKNYLEKRGRVLFLVPLVALAYQKYERFSQKYGHLTDVSIITGSSRIMVKENRRPANRNADAGILVATYEGIDHLMRLGESLSGIGTVIIDEVQMLEDRDRGHRVDGLISRMKFASPKAQYLYLSATIGHPKLLAAKLGCQLVRYDDRPVSLERYLIFTEREQKIPTERAFVAEEYNRVSEKGYHGQTIIFTNSRARCHIIAEKIGEGVAPYHAGLTHSERRLVEEKFEKGQLRAVVTTAALAAGVDFPASQVIFDSLAMGIEWLTVQEFQQMSGRAGRPDYHDLGKVVILAEPGGSYIRGSHLTEEEVAMGLLKGEMGEVAPQYTLEQSSELYVANAVICKGIRESMEKIEGTLVGETEPVEEVLLRKNLISLEKGNIRLSPLARVMAEHFIGVERLSRIMGLVHEMKDPLDILSDLECASDEEVAEEKNKKTSSGSDDAGRKKKRRGRRIKNR
ncbi:DEAD/DEAH box helicase [Methanospirillum stamsii]|uniref:DEAD/DEAH box helicase n=1 Tax=Methanospirillum stamsii TaxID=1277351 RepID=A0A2V2NFL9_9EURY|nr:DEAD/DEAH box helicase [Methanospirillum stamsii]PWR75187.1 DEAD/DEAH box helicase [Methanospirillum stamsii]